MAQLEKIVILNLCENMPNRNLHLNILRFSDSMKEHVSPFKKEDNIQDTILELFLADKLKLSSPTIISHWNTENNDLYKKYEYQFDAVEHQIRWELMMKDLFGEKIFESSHPEDEQTWDVREETTMQHRSLKISGEWAINVKSSPAIINSLKAEILIKDFTHEKYIGNLVCLEFGRLDTDTYPTEFTPKKACYCEVEELYETVKRKLSVTRLRKNFGL
jgi:hypothetical protein